MEYRRFESKIFARIDKGEEILQKLKEICEVENIKLASVSALGAINKLTVGVFNVDKKTYRSNEFNGNFEIVSLTGNVTTRGGDFYAHLHMSVGDADGKVFGGHLNRATVSATCEMVLDICDGTVEREFNGEVGLNLFKF